MSKCSFQVCRFGLFSIKLQLEDLLFNFFLSDHPQLHSDYEYLRPETSSLGTVVTFSLSEYVRWLILVSFQ